MWIHVPETYLASAPASEESSLDSTQPWMEELARSLTWKTNSVSPASLQRVWRTVPSIQRLSGLTSEPSTQNRGVEKWISSLAASHASHIPKLERNFTAMTKESFQERSSESPTGLDFQISFLKTSPAFYGFTGTTYDPNYERWVTKLRKDSSLRQKRTLLTRENGSSSWPTPQNKDYKRENLPAWEARQQRKAKEGINLQQNLCIATLKNWPTPTGTDYKGFNPPGKQNTKNDPEMYLSIPQAPTTTKDGHTCSPSCRRLNPLFAEMLMGLPPGWTDDSEPLATGLFRQWQHSLSESLR